MNPLDQLRDLHLPPAPVIWPPAPGWLLLLVLSGSLLILLLWTWIHYRRRNAYRRAALSRTGCLLGKYDFKLADALKLVRQTAISASPESRLATLSGPELMQKLDQFNDGKISEVLGLDGTENVHNIDHFLYGETPLELTHDQRKYLLQQISRWIKKHRREDVC